MNEKHLVKELRDDDLNIILKAGDVIQDGLFQINYVITGFWIVDNQWVVCLKTVNTLYPRTKMLLLSRINLK